MNEEFLREMIKGLKAERSKLRRAVTEVTGEIEELEVRLKEMLG